MAAYASSATGGSTSGTVDRTVTITPAVGDLLVGIVGVRGNSTTTPTASDDQGGTYTLVEVAPWGAGGSTLSLFVADQLVTSAVATTITFATGSNTSGNTAVIAVSGMSKTGATAVVQSASQDNQSSGTPTVALGAAAQTGNMLIGAVSNNVSPEGNSAPASWTERADIGQSTPNNGLEVVTIDSGFTGSSVTWGGSESGVFGALVVELDASGAGGTTFNVSAGAQVGTTPAVIRATILSAIADVVATVAADTPSFIAGGGVDNETDFETVGMVIGDWFDQQVGSTMSLATDQSHSSSHSAKVVQTGSAQGSFHTLTSSQTQVLRVWFRVHSLPASSNVNLFQFDTPSAFTIRLQPDGTVRGLFASSTSVNYGTISLDVWHSLDVLVDASGTQFTADVQLDGAAQTQALSATGQTPSNITTLKVANAGADSTTWWSDDYRHTHDSTQYPLGDSSGTTYFVNVSDSVATAVVLVRASTLSAISDSVATTAADARATTLNAISDSVATTAADQRATTLGTISDSVATTGAVSTATTWLRSAAASVGTVAGAVADFIAASGTTFLVSASASVSVSAAAVRQAALAVSDSVATVANTVRQAQLSRGDVVPVVGGVLRASALAVGDSVAAGASVARRGSLRAAASVSTVAQVARRLSHSITAAVATVAQAVLLRAIPASPNPERSNQITVTQEPNQISVQQTINVVSVATEPNQTRITNNGVNIITVEEA